MQASFRIARAIGKTKTGLAFAESGDVSAEKIFYVEDRPFSGFCCYEDRRGTAAAKRLRFTREVRKL